MPKDTQAQLFAVPNGWINNSGEFTPCEACDITFDSDNQFGKYRKGDTFGFVNTLDSSFKSPTFLAITKFVENKALAKSDKGWNIIDTLGNLSANVKCHYAYPFSNGLARIQLGNRFGFINAQGEAVIPVSYFGAYDFNEGKARVFHNGKWGFIDTTGEWLISPKYDYAWDFSEGSACVMNLKNRDEKWGFIDATGKTIIEQKYEYIFPFSNGLAIVKKQPYPQAGLKLINIKGEIKYELVYKDIFPFKEEMACFLKEVDGKNLWGFIDTNNNIVIEPQFDQPSDFNNGLALITKEGKKMYIDKSGKIIWKK